MKTLHGIQKIVLFIVITCLSAFDGYSTEPSWVTGYPQVLSGASSADLKVKVDENSTVYYIVFSSAQSGITAAQIKDYSLNGGHAQIVRRGNSVVIANSEYTIEEISLTDNSTYHIYIVGESDGTLMNDSKISYTSRFFPKRQLELTTFTNNVIPGFMVYFPEDYYKDNNDYPLLVFLHGAGQRSNSNNVNFNELRETGLPLIINNGKEIPMVAVSPQAKYSWDNSHASVDQFIEYIKTTYRIDEDKIFLTGLSMGGYGVFDYVNSYPQKVRAMVPVATTGVKAYIDINNFIDVPLWAFQGTNDPSNIEFFVEDLDGLGGDATFTEYVGGHPIWNEVYSGSEGDDIYAWLLAQGAVVPNDPPVVSAGSDQEITLPESEFELTGTASDGDGTIASVQWTKISGPSVTLANTNTTTLTLTNITAGVYNFEFSAEDDDGATSDDLVTLTVNSGAVADKEFFVNLTWSTNEEGGIWNDFITTGGGTSGTPISLVDSDSEASDISLSMVAAFANGNNNHGVVPGVFPTDVMRYFLRSTQTTVGQLKLSGLDVNKLYDFSFLASNYDTYYPSDTRFTIGSSSATVNAKGNDDQLVDITDVVPNSSGEITIEVAPATSASNNHGVINAMVIQERSINLPPVVSAGMDQEITLPVSEFELSGIASDNDGTVAMVQWTKISGPSVTLTDANTVTLTLTNITAGVYTFELSAEDDDGAITDDQVILTVNESPELFKVFFVNLTWSTNQEGGEWNDFITTNGGTTATPITLFDSDNEASDISLSMVAAFASGNNNHGVVPGVFSEDVMRYYLRSTQTTVGQLKLSGLDENKLYDFSFLASNYDTYYPSDTRFTIGSSSVTVNAKGNDNQLVDITDVVPNSSDEITIVVAPATTTSNNHGVINAMIITEKEDQSGRRKTSAPEPPTIAKISANPEPGLIKFFPNPVDDYLYIQLVQSTPNQEDPYIELFDLRGVQISKVRVSEKLNAVYSAKVHTGFMKAGMYLMQIRNGDEIRQLKVLKK